MNLKDEKKEFRDIKYILTSSMRTKLLISLKEGGKNLELLRRDIPKPSATILHGLKELEKLNYVTKYQKEYHLTSNGEILSTNMIKLIENWYTISNNEIFWNNHLLDDLPQEALRNLFMLKDAECITSTNTDLTRALNCYVNIISTSKTLKIILPIYSETHLNIITELLESNELEKIEILTTNTILNSIKMNYSLKNKLKNKKISIKILKKDIKLFLTCTDKYMTMNMFFNDGHFDDSQLLLSKSEDGIKWGLNLFNKFKKEFTEA